MTTKRQPQPSLRKLLLLSTHALVASSTTFTALNVLNGQPERNSSVRPATVAKEERTFTFRTAVVSTLEKIAKVIPVRVLTNEAFIDDLFRDEAFLTRPQPYYSLEFKEIASKVIEAEVKWDHAMTLLFEGLARAKMDPDHRVRVQDFYDLLQVMLDFKATPEQPVPQLSVARGRPVNTAIVDSIWLKDVVLGLQVPLFQFWKLAGLSLKSVYKMLRIDVRRMSLFKDPNMLLWIDFVVEICRKSQKKPFEVVLEKLRKESLDDYAIAARLVHADAESNPGSVAESLMTTLFHSWTVNQVKADDLLHRLMPSSNKGILNSPLKLWIEYFKPELGEKLYSILVRTLVKPLGFEPFKVSHASKQQQIKEMELVDIIAADWAKSFRSVSRKTLRLLPSSLANHLFSALCELWKQRSMSPFQLWKFLRIDTLRKKSNLWTARRRAWGMFVLKYEGIDREHELLEKSLTEKEMIDLIALSLNWDRGF